MFDCFCFLCLRDCCSCVCCWCWSCMVSKLYRVCFCVCLRCCSAAVVREGREETAGWKCQTEERHRRSEEVSAGYTEEKIRYFKTHTNAWENNSCRPCEMHSSAVAHTCVCVSVKLHQERALTAEIASKSALLGETAASSRTETSAAHTRPDGRRRRERRGEPEESRINLSNHYRWTFKESHCRYKVLGCVPVAQIVDHGARNTSVRGSIPSECMNWSNVCKC